MFAFYDLERRRKACAYSFWVLNETDPNRHSIIPSVLTDGRDITIKITKLSIKVENLLHKSNNLF